MTEVDATAVETIRKLQESIDTLNLNDKKGWEDLCDQLVGVKAHFEGQPGDLTELADLCHEGLVAISRKSFADTLSLVDPVYEGLRVIEAFLQGETRGDGSLQQAAGELARLLGGGSDLAAINDIATELIQLDCSDNEGLQQLRDRIQTVGGREDLPEAAAVALREADSRIDAMLAVTEAQRDEAALGTLGDLVEAAMEAVEAMTEEPVGEGMTDHQESVSAEGAQLESPAGGDTPVAVAQIEKIDVPPQEERSDYMPADADPELIGEFVTEGSELITNAEDALLRLEVDPEDNEAVGTVFRAFHTVKGTAAFMELDLVSEMAHHAESLLSRVRDGEIRYSGGYADLALHSLDMIKDLIQRVQAALAGEALQKPESYDQLMQVLADPEAAGVSEDTEQIEGMRVGDILVAQGKVDRETVEAAAETGRDRVGMALVKSKAATVEEVGQALRTQKRISGPAKFTESSVRVSTSRLDKLIDMVGEMVIAHSMVAQDDVVIRTGNHELQKKVAHTSKIVRELQDLSMSMRMVPLKSTFNKMARLVRDLSRKVGKQVALITEGEETEIDRNLVDIVNDPLVHMVRNAVDHGIESPEEREAAGKPAAGRVKLLAYHSAGSVVVEIRDDGKGLDRQKILEKARDRGLVEDGCTMTDREVFNLIFEPGFSTAETVTDVSGRGVGMDVVKKNIESLRGQVEIQSELGKGSIFKMRLPLTLAIIDGMVVRVGQERYIIPTVSIVRLAKPGAEALSSVFKQEEMLLQNGGLIPLFSLAELYGIEAPDRDPENTLVVVIEDDGHQAGLVIDELIGRQQVVIKTLGESMKNVPGISGGAILPNGRVGLIIDVGGILRMATAAGGDSRGAPAEEAVCYG
jgi:two-component system chemotaxis sensor kinase CheA